MPPSTGPAIRAAWNVIELRATSHGRTSGATTSAGSERAEGATKARPTPKASTRAKIGPTAVRPDAAYQASPRPQAASPHAAIDDHPPAIEAVGHRAADEDQERGGGELGQAQEAQAELLAGEVEDLLAERRHRHQRGACRCRTT